MPNCTESFWTGDDFSICARGQLETIPLEAVTAISALLVIRQVAKVILKRRVDNDPARQPLLQRSEEDETEARLRFEDQDNNEYKYKVMSYGAVFKDAKEQKADPVQVDENYATGSKSEVTIATIVRPTSERIRVALEWLLVLLQTLLAVTALFFSDITGQWEKVSGIPVTTVYAAFWVYAFLLVSYRVLYVSSDKTPTLLLWRHSTTLYASAFFTLLIPLRSSFIHPYSSLSRWSYVLQGILTIALVFLNFSAKFGDKPARIYVTKNPPNNENVSSLFDLLFFSFASGYIWRGYREHITAEHVPELAEDDHAFQALKRFRKFRKNLSFAWTVLRTFRFELSMASCYAVLYGLSIFGPAIFVKLLLTYIDNPGSVPRNVAWLYVVAMFVLGILKSFGNGQALHIGRRMGVRLRAILIGEIYAKALKRKASAAGGSLGKEKEDKKDDKGDEEEPKKDDKKKEDSTQANVGAIINLMSIDAYKVADVCPILHIIVAGILQIVIAIFLLYVLLGWSAFVGALAVFCFLPLNYWFSNKFSSYQNKLMKVTDQRVEKTNEVLQSIRIIKFFAWESRFADGVREYREKELQMLKSRYVFWACGAALFFGTPATISALTFASYTLLQKQTLTAPVAFTSMALFQIMRMPTDMLAWLLSAILQGKVSLDRITEFLTEEETDKYNQLSHHSQRGPNSPYIGFENASFSWSGLNVSEESDDLSDPQKVSFKLRDLNVHFPVGKMSVIVGPTGSGKTSLLMALLGEMDLDEGRVYLPGACSREDVKIDENGFTDTVAYCAQQAWLLNDTLKNNIIFASDYDEGRYNAVIEACQLKRDLEILDGGDETEVGEKGIALSGGQKQRISLARAIYSRSKHLILDDCLSAVDSHTALAIYNECLAGPIAAGRTIILVSHNVALTISQAEKVIVLDNGRIKAQGTPSEVLATGHLGQDDLVRDSASASGNPSRVASTADLSKIGGPTKKDAIKDLKDSAERLAVGDAPEGEAPPPPPEQKKASKLVQDEYMARGGVDKKVYLIYFRAMGKWWYWILIIGTYLLVQGFNVLQSWWVREWTLNGMSADEQPSVNAMIYTTSFATIPDAVVRGANQMWTTFKQNDSESDLSIASGGIVTGKHGAGYYISMYYGIAMISVFASVVRELIVFNGSLRASRLLFDRLLNAILRAPSRFFDSTPVGRIMNRFSKDIEGIDQEFAAVALDFFHAAISTITTVALITYITPGFMIAGVFIAGFYYVVAVLYLTSSRELKRIDSVSKSPIFQHFGETLVGISTIRAYGDQRRFVRDNLKLIDKNHSPFFYLWVANRWLYFRVDVIGCLVTAGAAGFLLMALGKIDSGLAGLSLSYALTFNEMVLWFVRLYAELEMQGNAVERLQEFMDITPEAPAIIEDSRPPHNWPSKGEVEFKDLSLRYAADLPLVIKDVSFKVDSFNKVGIVGRTGAGKSTIITALFRILEADSGSIEIDGLDVSTIGLQDLREALAIIPQDPTLFVGTIKSNLDPFEQYTDAQIYEALRRVHLITNEELAARDAASSASSVSSQSTSENKNQFLNLSSPVIEGGNNLSQGQRQLMCLARSLLKSPKVLLLDEATASIDYDTDAQIQKTIRDEFTNTTLLTIAHRLRSIVDYDKILVLDAGEVVEYDEPHALLEKKGVFFDMCDKSGELDQLTQLAKEAYEKKRA